MIVIPAIDIIEGKGVRLSKGDYLSRKEYSSNPVERAKRFEGAGLTHLHLVDLDGAKGGRPENLDVLERIARETSLYVDFGGGVKSLDSLKSVLDSGAREVSLGSVAVKDRESVLEWIDLYKDQLILSADVRDGSISISGWKEDTRIEALGFIEYFHNEGINKVISTDISRDGMLSGPSFELYQQIKRRVPGMKVVASGGISCLDDLLRLGSEGVWGAIVGKAYYEGRISLSELKEAENAC